VEGQLSLRAGGSPAGRFGRAQLNARQSRHHRLARKKRKKKKKKKPSPKT
jgi:hypothetical protein